MQSFLSLSFLPVTVDNIFNISTHHYYVAISHKPATAYIRNLRLSLPLCLCKHDQLSISYKHIIYLRQLHALNDIDK